MEHYKAEVSPDGNWIIYNREDQNAFYIGDLRTGHTKLYEPEPFIFHYDWSWSSDNQHFVYSATPGNTLYLGSVDGSPELIGKGEFQGWIDPNRFFYYADKNIVMGDVTGSKQIIIADHETFKNRATIFTFILPKAPEK
jgi:WD40 repeat protein